LAVFFCYVHVGLCDFATYLFSSSGRGLDRVRGLAIVGAYLWIADLAFKPFVRDILLK